MFKLFKPKTYLWIALFFPIFLYLGLLSLNQFLQSYMGFFYKEQLKQLDRSIEEILNRPEAANLQYADLLGNGADEMQEDISSLVENNALLVFMEFKDPRSEEQFFIAPQRTLKKKDIFVLQKKRESLFGETMMVVDIGLDLPLASLNLNPVHLSNPSSEKIWRYKDRRFHLLFTLLNEPIAVQWSFSIPRLWIIFILFIYLTLVHIGLALVLLIWQVTHSRFNLISINSSTRPQETSQDFLEGIETIRHEFKHLKKAANNAQPRPQNHRSSKEGPTKVNLSIEAQKEMMNNLVGAGKKTALIQDPSMKKEIIFDFANEENIQEITIPKVDNALEKMKKEFTGSKAKSVETDVEKTLVFNTKYKDNFQEIDHPYLNS